MASWSFRPDSMETGGCRNREVTQGGAVNRLSRESPMPKPTTGIIELGGERMVEQVVR